MLDSESHDDSSLCSPVKKIKMYSDITNKRCGAKLKKYERCGAKFKKFEIKTNRSRALSCTAKNKNNKRSGAKLKKYERCGAKLKKYERCGAKLKKFEIKTNRSRALPCAAKNKKNALAKTKLNNCSYNCDELSELPSKYRYRELGIFEFPWQSETGALAPELKRYRLRDVFFSSLVDGCAATIGFPGDRLSRPNASPIILPPAVDESMPSGVDAGEFDYIWSSILRQPLSVVCCARTSAA